MKKREEEEEEEEERRRRRRRREGTGSDHFVSVVCENGRRRRLDKLV